MFMLQSHIFPVYGGTVLKAASYNYVACAWLTPHSAFYKQQKIWRQAKDYCD